MWAAYAECAEGELGLLLAERIALLGLQPFNTTTVRRASRQIEVIVHHMQLKVHALPAPLPPLPSTTRVLVAMCGISERDDQQCVRDFYRSNLAAELCCDGSHLEVCIRCATNDEPAFAASLTSLLHAIEAEPALGGSRTAGSSGASRVAQLGLALSQEEERLAPPQLTAVAATADAADHPSMRVRVVGGEEVPGNGLVNVRAHVAYVLRLEMAGGSSRECVVHRFSDFAALLDRLKKGPGDVPGGGAAGQSLAVEGWARRLLIERRHTGSRARAEGVVTTRCKLLQKMMDELMALPEFASSPEVGAFLFG